MPDLEPAEGPDGWHPLDLLAAPLYDDAGELRGLLTVDVSHSTACVPGPPQRDALARYAGVARSSVLLALEREELAERVRLATEARGHGAPGDGGAVAGLVMNACRAAVVSSFDAGRHVDLRVRLGRRHVEHVVRRGRLRPPGAGRARRRPGPAGAPLLGRPVRRALLAPATPTTRGSRAEEADLLLDFLGRIGIGSVLFVPLGAGVECLGFLVLSRVSDVPPWTQLEYDAALDIGRDLGRAIANARQLDAERALVNRLRDLDGYRVELVNTVAHELRNPLSSVVGNLELLEDEVLATTAGTPWSRRVRGARRIEGVIDDLLTMARVSDPDAGFDPVPVDLRQVVRDVVDECGHAADARSITITTSLAGGGVPVPGRPDELHRMLANLLSNALKYSDDGASVAVEPRPTPTGTSRSPWSDHGLGISEDDQRDLFREFFRSTNPEALARPGSGLGLVIVDRIVRRHGGRVAVDSALGRGTTVTVTLPSGLTRPPRRCHDLPMPEHAFGAEVWEHSPTSRAPGTS